MLYFGMHKGYLKTDEEFFNIYSKVPRLNVDLVIKNERGVLFAQRNDEPNIGSWNLIGGRVFKDETIKETIDRVALSETGLEVRILNCLGYMEFLHEARVGVHDKNLKGDVHTVSIVFLVEITGGELKKEDLAKELKFFTEIPENTVIQHREFLEKNVII